MNTDNYVASVCLECSRLTGKCPAHSSFILGSITFYPAVQQGWQCPICRRVHAPWMATCDACGKKAEP